ncbi:TonB-dependent receptor plug domain-containing protein [Spongiivirga citrea]|uniref:TonB-dependent receptor n=1 Tax=Spongiivirga citrea TaxID=1481457 RepID=A0A6M0CQW8_9FLAO|nr:TonB-dependent receptor [Spongiivirga citrea]NER18464.1 TonB-dependent receptor [Spongiivirga citrea]
MIKRLASFGALVCTCTVAVAQQEEVKEQQLEEVVVSDSRFELKRENSGKTVIKIDQKEIERNQGRTLVELINTKSGIEINGSRSNAGSVLGTFVRGGNNRQVLVVIDGVQVSDPSNVNAEFDLRLISLDQIESIEILKGAASTLYGTAAASAVINITTKKASADGLRATINSSFGTNQAENEDDYRFNDFSNQVNLFGKSDKVSANVGFGHQSVDGLSAGLNGESDPFSRINAIAGIGYQVSEKFKVDFGFNYDKFNAAFDNFDGADRDFESISEQTRFRIAPTYNYGKGSVTANVAINDIDREINSDFPNTFDSQTLVGDVFNKYTFNDKLYTIVGVNYIKQKTRFNTIEEETTTTDPYANVVYVSEFGLNLNAGVRLNNHSEYGSNFIYNVNPSYVFRTGDGYIKAFGSYATSFITPNLSQLFGPFGANPDLDPETNTTFELGLEFKDDNFRISGVAFSRKEKDFIDFVVVDFTTFAGEFQNVADDFEARGVEVEIDYLPIKNLNITVNNTFIERPDQVRLRLPKNKINASVGYQFNEKTFASLQYQYTSSRVDTDFSTFTNVDLDSFALLDIYANHQLTKRMKLFVGVSNLLNEEYLEVIGFTTKGRNVRFGFILNL